MYTRTHTHLDVFKKLDQLSRSCLVVASRAQHGTLEDTHYVSDSFCEAVHTLIHRYSYTHVHTYSYTHAHAHTHSYTHTLIHTHTHTHTHSYTHTLIHTHTHTHILIHTHTHAFTHTTHTPHTHALIHTHTHSYTHTHTFHSFLFFQPPLLPSSLFSIRPSRNVPKYFLLSNFFNPSLSPLSIDPSTWYIGRHSLCLTCW